jgi:hypothetical protein
MKNISDRHCRENQNTYSIFNNFSENRAVYEAKWKNFAEPGRPWKTIWRTRIECCISKATNRHSEYKILIAFPLQQWLQERASMSCYTYIATLVFDKTYSKFS